ncbi:methyltransferase domain-containing protein [Staphylococcus simulans]|uniref:methyltransferase domain-containing protein n=1 Tax=Staphylococcus simulans TaxID=1286 RepID=UPI001E43F1AC|nr:methyltransferase domain-containing protein [Staphylococcus simulans]MCD8914335.1 methyltransferase domain-containing protein [Staphylococcus simulans]
MNVGDKINIDKQWSFKHGVAKHFDIHAKHSIPLYEEGHNYICYLSDFFIKNGSHIYELGCSTGTLIEKLYKRHKNKSNIHFIGVDSSNEMIELARKKCKKIRFINKSLLDIQIKKSDLIICYYVLQFIDLENRLSIIKNIFNSLHKGGAFILFEKELSDNSKVDKILSSCYLKFKINQNFTPNEILDKQFSLEGMMKTNTYNENLEMLKNTGFTNVETIMKYGEFNGYLCIK